MITVTYRRRQLTTFHAARQYVALNLDQLRADTEVLCKHWLRLLMELKLDGGRIWGEDAALEGWDWFTSLKIPLLAGFDSHGTHTQTM